MIFLSAKNTTYVLKLISLEMLQMLLFVHFRVHTPNPSFYPILTHV